MTRRAICRPVFVAVWTLAMAVSWNAAGAAEPTALIEAVQRRVVQIRGWEDGVGFVVGERDGRLVIVTANHVVRSEGDGATAPQTLVRLLANPDLAIPAEVSSFGYERKPVDLAVLTVEPPAGTELPPTCAPDRLASYRLPVWAIGLGGTWEVSYSPGHVGTRRPDRDDRVRVEIGSISERTSGAPLVSEQGIVAMILENAGAVDKHYALSIERIRSELDGWGFPFSLEPCETLEPPRQASTRFPLLEDPPAELWRNKEARELFFEAKERVEWHPFFCTPPPAFGVHSWPLRSPDEIRVAPHPSYTSDTVALTLMDRSLTLEANAWTRLYRGLLLARIRAFTPALEDLELAARSFESNGEFSHVETAQRVLERVRSWRSAAIDTRSLSLPASCGGAEPRTVCELIIRAASSELAAREPEKLETDLRALLGAHSSEPAGFVAPSVKAQLDCAFELAKSTPHAELSVIVFEFLVDQARIRGLRPLLRDYLAAQIRKLAALGHTTELQVAARRTWPQLERGQRAQLLAELSLAPELLPTSFDRLLELDGTEIGLASDLRALQRAATELRGELQRFSAAMDRVADQRWASWYREAVRYLENEESRAHEELLDLLPPTPELGLRLASLLRMARSARGNGEAAPAGGAIADPLGTKAEAVVEALTAVARHGGPFSKLEQARERADAFRKPLLEAFGALVGTHAAALRSASAGDLLSAVATATALDVPPPDGNLAKVDLLVSPLSTFGSSEGAEAIRNYRQAAHLFTVLVEGVLPLDPRAELLSSTIAQKFGLTSLEDLDETFSTFDRCAETAAHERRFRCAGGATRKLLEGLAGSLFGKLTPLLGKLHHDAEQATQDAFLGGDPRSSDSVYLMGLVDAVAARVTEAALAATPAEEQMLLVAAGLLLDFLAEEIDLELETIDVGIPALRPEVKELMAAFMVFDFEDPELPQGAALERNARQARHLLRTSRQITVSLLVLANPVTYHDLSPQEIADLLERARRDGLDESIVQLGLSLSVLFADEALELPLRYEQLEAIVDHLDPDRSINALIWWPLAGPLLRYSSAVEPLVQRPEWSHCDAEGELYFGAASAESNRPGLSLAAENRSAPVGMLGCICCVEPTWGASALAMAAARESRWRELERILHEMAGHADERWHGALGALALDLFDRAPDWPAPLGDLALRTLLDPAIQEALTEEDELALVATLLELGEARPPLPSLPDRAARLALLQRAGDKIGTFIFLKDELTFESLFEHTDRLARVVEHSADPELEWRVARQTSWIRRRAAAFVALGDERVAIGEAFVDDVMTWLEERAADDDLRALEHVGAIRLATGDPTTAAEAVALIRRAAERGSRSAMIELGITLARGLGVPADPGAAQAWLRQAIDRGSAQALVALGEIHLRGWGVVPDPVKARRWFLEAAEAGYPEGKFQLALLDLTLTDEATRASNLERLRRVAELGHPEAAEALRQLEDAIGLRQPR